MAIDQNDFNAAMAAWMEQNGGEYNSAFTGKEIDSAVDILTNGTVPLPRLPLEGKAQYYEETSSINTVRSISAPEITSWDDIIGVPLYIKTSIYGTSSTTNLEITGKDGVSIGAKAIVFPTLTGSGLSTTPQYYWVRANGVYCVVWTGAYLVCTNMQVRNATTSYSGIVQLSDSVNSTSPTLAATANAVKKAYDLAAAADPSKFYTKDEAYSPETKALYPPNTDTPSKALEVLSGGMLYDETIVPDKIIGRDWVKVSQGISISGAPLTNGGAYGNGTIVFPINAVGTVNIYFSRDGGKTFSIKTLNGFSQSIAPSACVYGKSPQKTTGVFLIPARGGASVLSDDLTSSFAVSGVSSITNGYAAGIVDGIFVLIPATTSSQNISTAYFSEDNCVTWTPVNFPAASGSYPYSALKIVSGNGMLISLPRSFASPYYFTSFDKGRTWVRQLFPFSTNESSSGIAFHKGKFYVCGGRTGASPSYPIIWTSEDCVNWIKTFPDTTTITNVPLDIVDAGDSLIVIPNGMYSTCYYSNDGGATWNKTIISSETGSDYIGVYMDDRDEVAVLYQLSGWGIFSTKNTFRTVSEITDILGNRVQLPSAQLDSRLQIEVGSYVGTGTFGSSNPNTLTFDGVPQVVFLYTDTSLSGYQFTAINGSSSASVSMLINGETQWQNLAGTGVTINISGKSFYWYNGINASYQLNQNNVKYGYLALTRKEAA